MGFPGSSLVTSLVVQGFPCGSTGKESTCNGGDLGSIPGLGRSPGEGKGYPLQYSGLENSMDCIGHRVQRVRYYQATFTHFTHFPGSSAGKESACNTWGLGLIPGLGRALGGGHDNPFQYSCLENPHGQRSLASYSPWGHTVRHDWATKPSTAHMLIPISQFIPPLALSPWSWFSWSSSWFCRSLLPLQLWGCLLLLLPEGSLHFYYEVLGPTQGLPRCYPSRGLWPRLKKNVPCGFRDKVTPIFICNVLSRVWVGGINSW